MRYINIILVFFFFLSCQTEKKICSINNTPENQITKKVPIIRTFNGVIEDFESQLDFWNSYFESKAVFKKITMEDMNVGIFEFDAPYSLEEYHQFIPAIIYKRKMDFTPYQGVKFLAKGQSDIMFKFKIFEKENYYDDKRGREVWFKEFYVQSKWQEYRIDFNEMNVEEFWEQNYISDNFQMFTNIIGICITAQNTQKKGTIRGQLYIDNIMLY